MEPTSKKSAKSKPVVYRPLPKKLEDIQTNETQFLTHTFRERMPKGATPFSSPSVNVWNSLQENNTTKTESLDRDNYQKAMANIDKEMKLKARRISKNQPIAKPTPAQYISGHQYHSLHPEEGNQVFEEEFSVAGASYIPPTAIYGPTSSTLNVPVGYDNIYGYESLSYQLESPQHWQQNATTHSHPTAFSAQSSTHTSVDDSPSQLAMDYSEHPHSTMSYEREYFDYGFSSTSSMSSVVQTSMIPSFNLQVNDYDSFPVPAHPATHIHTLSHGESNSHHFPAQHDSTYMYYQTRY